ncbi:MAG: DUF4249 domain-containing protein [bacterium]
MLQQAYLIKIIRYKAALPCAFIFILFIINSCTEKINIELEIKPQYVVNCLFSPDKDIQLFVFKTTNILNKNIETENNLHVELYKGDNLIWEGKTNVYGVSIIPLIPETAKSYSIRVDGSQNLALSASDTVPEKISILKAEYTYPVYTDKYHTQFGKLSVSFNDDPNRVNYYEIVLLNARDSTINLTFNVNHPVITLDNENDPNPPGSLLFTDELFEGQQVTLDIFTDSEKPLVVLKNISRNYYEYKKSLNAHLYSQNTKRETVYELFKADPVELYSNVNNGLGIFAGYTQDISECKMINP